MVENLLYLLEGGFKIEDIDNCRAYILDNIIAYNSKNLYDKENDLIHELIHIFSMNDDMLGFLYGKDEFGRAINEGFTELYAMRAQGIEEDYDIHIGTARALEIISEADYTDAYFNSDVDALYEKIEDKNKLKILFETLDKKMYYDSIEVDNNINYYAQNYLIDIMFEKIHNEILEGHYVSLNDILNKLDEVRYILSNDKMNEEYQEDFDAAFDTKYEEIIQLYLQEKDYDKDIDIIINYENGVNLSNGWINLGKFDYKNREYKIHLIDGKVKYLFETDNIKVEASDFISDKFNKLLGVLDSSTNLIPSEEEIENGDSSGYDTYIPISEVDIDLLFNEVVRDRKDSKECNIFKILKKELFKYQDKFSDINGYNLTNNIMDLKIKFIDKNGAFSTEYDTTNNVLYIQNFVLEEKEDTIGHVLSHELGHIISSDCKSATDGNYKRKSGFMIGDEGLGITDGFTELYAALLDDNLPRTYYLNVNTAGMISLLKDSYLRKAFSCTDYPSLYNGIDNKTELFKAIKVLDFYTYWTINKDNNDAEIQIENTNFISQIQHSMLNVLKGQISNKIENNEFDLEDTKYKAESFLTLLTTKEDLEDLQVTEEEIDLEEYSEVIEEYNKFVKGILKLEIPKDIDEEYEDEQ